jgi:hypothetical protein
MADYDGWKSTNEVFDVVISFLLQDGNTDIAKETMEIEVEKDRFFMREFTLSGTGSLQLPVFDYHIIAVKSDLPVDISKVDEYDIENSQFFYVRHETLAATTGDRVTITGTQDSGVTTTVRVMLIKEA